MTRTVLAIGAHPDDIEIGCGATLAKHYAAGDSVVMLVVTNGEAGPGNGRRLEEAEAASGEFGAIITFGGLPDGSVSNHELELVKLIEQLIRVYDVDTVYTHWHLDSHQDHRAIGLASWGACRHVPRVLCYEAPSSRDFDPSVFIDVTGHLDRKALALSHHRSQVQESRMLPEGRVEALAVVRGHTARVRHAEGFMAHRLVLQ